MNLNEVLKFFGALKSKISWVTFGTKIKNVIFIIYLNESFYSKTRNLDKICPNLYLVMTREN